MSIDGDWDVVVKSPMGEQKSVLTLHADGTTLTGSDKGTGASNEVKDGKISGDVLTWSVDVTTPMKMKIEIEVTVDGDKFAGTAKAGMFGKFPMTGTKRA
jgi:hypothetical protein